MVTIRQQREIKKLMRRIKDASDEGKPAHIVEERVADLTEYLHQEGLINSLDDE